MGCYPFPMQVTLTSNECRVLGTLIEKAMTVPSQYPMTLNALVNGCNQRSNRDPVTNLGEDEVLAALDGLRAKGFSREVSLEGSRVPKFRHVAREAIEAGASELAILTELMLRGPQTVGELRSRASRMHPLESLDVVQAVLESLAGRPIPLVERLPPAPGSRAERHRQLLCPERHPSELSGAGDDRSPAAVATADGGQHRGEHSTSDLAAERLAALEAEVAELRDRLDRLERDLGAPSAHD